VIRMLGSLWAPLDGTRCHRGQRHQQGRQRLDLQDDADLAVRDVGHDELDRSSIGRSLEVDQSLNLDVDCHVAPLASCGA